MEDSTSGLGLLLGLSVDNTQALQDMGAFQRAVNSTFTEAGKQTPKLNTPLLNTHQSVHLLAEEMGVHLPRAVISGISEMIPNVNMLGGAMLGVFAVEEVYKYGKAAVDMLHELQGETKELKKFWQEVISEQERLLRNPKVIADAQKEIRDTNRSLADLARGIEATKKELADLDPGAAIMAAVISHRITKMEEEQTKLQARLEAQHAAYNQLNESAHKEAETEEKAARATKEHIKWLTYGPTMAQLTKIGIDGVTKSTQEAITSGALWILQQQKEQYTVLPLSIKGHQELVQIYHQEAAAQQMVNRGLAESTAHYAGSIAGILETLGAKREAAAVMAIYETAEGFEALGHYDFWGAAQDFASAAMYAKVAGTSEHHHAASGGGGGAGSGYGSAGASAWQPQTMAPGATDAGGRFGEARVVVFGTDHELQNWVAGAVNRAVSRGVTVTATTSQRGAPVGH